MLCVARASSACAPTLSAKLANAILFRGKQGPPYPWAPFRYRDPILLSFPIAEVTLSTSPPGILSQISARVFAKLIFIVTYEFTEILDSSALTKLIRSIGDEFL